MPSNADRDRSRRRAADAGTKSTSRTSHRPQDDRTRGRGPSNGGGSPDGSAYRTAGEPPPFLTPNLAERSSNGLLVRPAGGDLPSPRTVHLLDRTTGEDRRRLQRVPAAAPRHHLPAVRDPHLCAALHPWDRPHRMGVVLGGGRRAVRHRPLGRRREPAQSASGSALDRLRMPLSARRTARTSNDLQDMGPIDYLVVEFPGSKMTGEGLPLLVD